MMIKHPALAPSPQPRPAPTLRALPAEFAAQRGPFWMPIRGPNPTPIDTTSDLPRRADIFSVRWHVSNVPFPDSCIAAKQTLFNHFVPAGEHRCRQIEEERLGGFQIGTWSASAPADQPASLRPLSAQSWAMQERPQSRPLRPKLRRSCRAVLAGASASVKSDAKCPRCLALHFWI